MNNRPPDKAKTPSVNATLRRVEKALSKTRACLASAAAELDQLEQQLAILKGSDNIGRPRREVPEDVGALTSGEIMVKYGVSRPTANAWKRGKGGILTGRESA